MVEARTLRRHLERATEPQPLRLFRDLARVVDPAWEIAVGADLAFPAVKGRRTATIRLVNRYVARLHAAAERDAALASAFVRVAGLIDRPEALDAPRRRLPRVARDTAPAYGTHRGRGWRSPSCVLSLTDTGPGASASA